MKITKEQYIEFINNVIVMIEEEKDYLCELDRKLGDGDHGITMSIGFQAVKNMIDSEDIEKNSISTITVKVAKTFLNAVGSSVGPLYATGFLRAAQKVKDLHVLEDDEIKDFWLAFANGIQERGLAEVGDKTMVDTTEPFATTLSREYDGDILKVFSKALQAAEQGMKSTQNIISKKGRSSRLGERSFGTQDPGATSVYLILDEFGKILYR